MQSNNLNILIVEDDPLISESLKDILRILNHRITGIADNADSAIEICNSTLPDLALLDIQISGDLNGVELAEILRDQFDIPFIFMTAYADNDTINKAKEKGPFGYLVKPYGLKEVNATIQIAMASYDRLKKAEKIKINFSPIIDNSFFIKVDSSLIKLKLNDILYIEAKGDYSLFKTKTKGYLVQTTMKYVENRLNQFRFQKTHRSFIVNLEKIEDIKEFNLVIEDKVIPISRSQKEQLLKKINLL